MNPRSKNTLNNVNLETIACERYMTRLLQRDLKEKTGSPHSSVAGTKSTVTKFAAIANNHQVNRLKPNVKQQNMPSPQPASKNVIEFNDDIGGVVEVTVKTTNARHRSRSRPTSDREPWGQVLKQQKSNEKVSVFGSFDPLRTLHFLAKELQIQLQNVLPDDATVQQMVSDIQHALKRVPPEVASSVHLQQALNLLPMRKDSKGDLEASEKQNVQVTDRGIQTSPRLTSEREETKHFYKMMEENTLKLEESCKQMEVVCTRLKNDKDYLEKQLESLRGEINTVLNPKIFSLEKENQDLQSNINSLKLKYDDKMVSSSNDLKSQLTEIKSAKNALEEECAKLKHQLRLSSIEKEKYVAILAVRDRQVSEIQAEMAQLQDVVNDQLLDLHRNAAKSMPGNELGDIKENIGDGTISTIYSNDDRIKQFFSPELNNSFKDLPSGDANVSEVFQKAEELLRDKTNREVYEPADFMNKLERFDSHVSIRNMFQEIKKTAYAVASTPKANHQNHE